MCLAHAAGVRANTFTFWTNNIASTGTGLNARNVAAQVTFITGTNQIEIDVTNLQKVFWPDIGRTKGDLIRYYAMVAPVMVPYLDQRPLNMHRFPNGVEKPGFWHKAVPSHAPEWITQWRYEDADEGETEWYFVADRPATIAWLANYGAVELHAWTSRIPEVRKPTYAMIDIDPRNGEDFVVERDGRVIGKAGLRRFPTIGYIFHPDAWGQGVATEALRPIIDRAFTVHRLAMIDADEPINQAYLDAGEWTVQIGDAVYPATVSLRPIYDPRNERIQM